jgi:hypothetical protein
MATVRIDFEVPVGAAEAWSLIADFGHPQELAPGFVAACTRTGDERLVTFASGVAVRELLVACEDDRRRLCYAAVGGRALHHQATMTVEDAGRRARIRGETDLLPDALAPFVEAQMAAGAQAIVAGVSDPLRA